MQGSRFHAAAAPDEADLRSTADVFKSAAGQSEGFKARFETAGKFTSEQLDAGDDVDSAAAPEAAEPGAMRAPRTHTHAASSDQRPRARQTRLTNARFTTVSKSRRTRSKRRSRSM